MRKSIFLLVIIFLLGCGDHAKSAESNPNSLSVEQISISSKAFEDTLSVLRKEIKLIDDKIVENSKNIESNKEEISNINKANNSYIGLFFLSIIINLIVLFVVLFLLLKKYLSDRKSVV